MSIVRAVIYFQLLHLIAGLSVDHCDDLGYAKQCLINVSSTNSQLRVECSIYRLEINQDSNIGNAFDENKLPSTRRLWDMCMNSHNETVKKEPYNGYFGIQWNVGIKQFPDKYFCDGPSLEWIVFGNNRLNDTRKLGFSSTANCTTLCLTRLREVYAENNAFEKVFNNSFCGLQGLTKLNMDSNRIKELERDAFVNLKSLTSLEMRNNSISVLPPGVFREQLNTLREISLGNNRFNSQSILELKNLKLLTKLYLEGNQIDILPKDFFKNMTQLTFLNLGNNFIKTLHSSLTNLTYLEWLSLSANNISVIRSEDFQDNIRLKLVHFSHNPITTVEPYFCAACDKMAIVNIANALLTTVPQFIFKSKKLLTLDLSNNRINYINVRAFIESEYIDSINLSFNQLTDISIAFRNCSARQLYLNHNRLTELSFADFSPLNLNYLSITHNNINTIDTSRDSIDKLWWSLDFLDLSHNDLNEIVDGSFDHLIVLNELNLAHNNLRHISENMFKKLRSLTQLFLSHNKIQTIEPNAFPIPLETLHLDNNQLLNFNVWQLDILSYLKKLSVSGNKWSCDLSERLEEWLRKNSRIINDIGKIVCEQLNATVPTMPPIHTIPSQ